MKKFKTIHPNMLVGGPKKLRSDDAGFIETDDPKVIERLMAHPYCQQVGNEASPKPKEPAKEKDQSNGGTDKGRTGSKTGRDRSAADKAG